MPRPSHGSRARLGAWLLVASLAWAGILPSPAVAESESEAGPAGPSGPEGEADAAAAERARRTGRDALVVLGEEALARGDLDRAEARFARVLATRPDSVRARVGAGRVARARGDREAARAHFERALEQAPDEPKALVELAGLEAEAGRPDRARALLEEALRRDFMQPAVHGELLALTGRAPGEAPDGSDALLERASTHPYDPRALRDAGVVLAGAGRGAEAARFFEKALWLADLDPEAARDAMRRLPEVDPGWQVRRVVPVIVFADDTVRDDPYWKFRLRLLWLSTSRSLDPVLATRFVVVGLNPLRAGSGPVRLQPWLERLREHTRRQPPGIVAGFTEREPPPTPPQELGLAEFLGRHLAVRLRPGQQTSRVLAHEILHIYGAIHVSPELDSLMNPSGASRRLDSANQEIARATRARLFRGRGLEEDLLATTDLEAVLAAYEQAMAVNLLFRNAGIAEALRSRDRSRVLAAREARRATELDSHLADVAQNLARLLLLDGRRGEALLMLDAAARLYREPTSARRARAQADALARALEAEYGRPGPAP